jgi:mannose-6-phosphate isomerase-like protein (cupin superfamily)
MSAATFFCGRLVVRTLPALTAGGGLDAPALKRLLLPQGELAQFHDSDVAIRYIAGLELTPGSVRGNHYHQIKVEHLYVMQGELELVAQEMRSGDLVQVLMKPGDLAIIQPDVAHAFRILQPGSAVEFAPTRFDPTDVHRHQLT